MEAEAAVEMMMDQVDQGDLTGLVDPTDKGTMGDCQGGMTLLTPINFKCLENFLDIVHPMPPNGCMAWHVGVNALACLRMITFGLWSPSWRELPPNGKTSMSRKFCH